MPQLICNNAFYNQATLTTPEAIIEKAVAEDALQSFVLVVPTNKLVRYYQMKAVRDYFNLHRKPATKLNIFSLDTFIKNCFNKIEEKKRYRIISDAYRLALFEEAAEKADLKFFQQKEKNISPVILERLSNVVFGLKEDGITVENLNQEISNAEETKNKNYDLLKMRDIASLYEAYQKILEDKFLDFPELLKVTIKLLTSSEDINEKELDIRNKKINYKILDSIFPGKPRILLYGFSEFKIPEVEFITLFAKSEIPYGIQIDYSTNNGPLFGNLEDNIFRLTNQGYKLYPIEENEKLSVSLSPEIDFSLPRSEYLKKWLFKAEKEYKNPNFSEIVKIFAFESQLEEVKAITKLVRYLHLKQGIPISEICIAMRQPDIYTTLFREYFSIYKVPANISDRFSLAKSPVVIAVFTILDVTVKGYRINDVYKSLQSPYLTFEKKDKNGKAVPIDGLNLYNTALNLRIKGGETYSTAGWKSRLYARIDALSKLTGTMSQYTSSDTFDLSNMNEELKNTKRALEDFEAFTKLIPSLKTFTAQEFCSLIKNEIINKFKLKENILKFYEYIKTVSTSLGEIETTFLLEEVEKDTRAFVALIEILDEMVFIIEERKSEQTFKLEKLVQMLSTTVTGARYQIKEKQNYGATITAIEQTRGIPFKVMILCGAIDGDFPMAYKLESFLGKEFDSSDTLNNPEERHIRSEKILFYQFMTNAPEMLDSGKKQIYITYPKYKETEENIRSPFIDALLKITSLEEDNCIYDMTSLNSVTQISDDENKKQNFQNLEFLNSIANESEYLELLGRTIRNDSKNENLKKGLDQIAENYSFQKSSDYIKKFISRKRTEEEAKVKLDLTDLTDVLHVRNPESPFSISDFDTYASCPFKYFVEKILNIKAEDKPEFDLSPIEKGNLFHQILYRFYREIQSQELSNNETEIISSPKLKGLPSLAKVRLDLSKEEFYKVKLFEIANEEINKIRYEHPFFKLEEEELMGTKDKPGYLEIWLKLELQRAAQGWDFQPALFEFGFGFHNPKNPDTEIPPVELAEGLKLRGKIDRVELREAEGTFQLLIADYKSTLGNVPSKKEIENGTSFQVPLYLYAAKKILTNEYTVDAEPSGGIYYALRPNFDIEQDPVKAVKFLLLTESNHLVNMYLSPQQKRAYTDSNIEQTLNNTIEFAKQIAFKISDGNFPVEPKPGACDYCNFQAICRINERNIITSEESNEED
ncbi:MAG: PD-(D/E)XK nuclease family protein [FCB group bacterium]